MQAPHSDRGVLRPFAYFSLLSLALIAGASAQTATGSGAEVDWPKWRGPEGTGVSSEAAWSPVGAAEPLWRRTIGLGHSSFAIVGQRVYTAGYDVEAGLDQFHCLDASTGESLWTHTVAAEIWDLAHDGGTQTTPTVVGERVVVSNREGKVLCLDAKSGAVEWQRDLRADKELEPPKWGFSASPLVVDGLVIMNTEHVFALDLETGEDRWQTEKGYGFSYSTPTAFELEGRALVAALNGDGLVVLDRETGAEIGFYEWIKRPQIYPMTPVVIGDRIFISAGYDRGCVMLRLNLAEGSFEELWASRVMRNKMSGAVLYEDHLYGFDESILKCIDLDGKMKWRVRGLGTGSMTIAGGRLVILDGKGQVIVAEANPEEYVELSKQGVFEDGTAWSTPVLSHGRIFCRMSKGEMACLDHRAVATPTPTPASAKLADAGAALPTAEELLARHRAALGDTARFHQVAQAGHVHLSGTGSSLRNTVKTGEVELYWAAGKGFSWTDATGFQLAHDAERGWSTGLRSGPELLEGEALDALREAGDLGRVMDPAGSYTNLTSQKRTVFDNRACYAVAATTLQGHARTIYFDVETGLLAGQDGEGIPLWTLSAYRDFEGVRLPTKWAFYEPVLGEMTSAEFDSASFTAPAESPFAVPPLVRLLLRTPAEIAADNERLAKLHAAILGTWRAKDAEGDDPDTRFEVAEGYLLMHREGPPSRLTEPKEDGVMHRIGSAYVRFKPVRDDSGAVTHIEIFVGRDLEAELVRVEE